MIGSCLMMALKGPRLLKREQAFIVKNKIAGVALFQRNIRSFKQLFQLNKQIKSLIRPAPLIAIDMEGGSVNRFSHLKTEKADWPSAEELSRLPPLKVFLTAKKMAKHLKDLGVDLNFAPVVDLPLVESEILKTRTFGKKPADILKTADPFFRGLIEGGIVPCLKHFPGHGGVTADSHKALPKDRRSLEDLKPQLKIFQKMFKDQFTCLMTAHIEFSEIEKKPATFSKILLTQILKNRMKFKGLVVSDDIDMKALSLFSPGESFFLAIKAGCDMVMTCQDLESPLKIIDYFERQSHKKEEIETELRRAEKRISQLRKQLC